MSLLSDVLKDKDEMKQRHEEDKQRLEQDRKLHDKEKQNYEHRLREMEEQLVLANQQKPGPSTSMRCGFRSNRD